MRQRKSVEHVIAQRANEVIDETFAKESVPLFGRNALPLGKDLKFVLIELEEVWCKPRRKSRPNIAVISIVATIVMKNSR